MLNKGQIDKKLYCVMHFLYIIQKSCTTYKSLLCILCILYKFVYLQSVKNSFISITISSITPITICVC